jgi:TPR repeat protein
MRFLDRLIGKRREEPTAAAVATGDDAAMARARQAFDNKDYAAAWAIWRDLAERGVPRAQSNLAGLYSYGWGVPRDEAVAAAWFRAGGRAGVPSHR